MKYLILVALILFTSIAHAQNNPDAILGRWESTEKNLVVEVYKQDNNFQAKILWFNNPNNALPELDIKNPDKDLRSRPIVGMDVLSGLQYNAKQNRWNDGNIYDCTSGHTWDATVWLTSHDELSVRGYYLVRWLGKTLNFIRVD